MNPIVWTSDLDIGIESIDNQHRKAIDAANVLQALIENHEPAEKVQASMTKINELLVAHSRFEEKLLEKNGYEYTDLHRQAHDKFNQKMQALQASIQSGAAVADEFVEEMSLFLDVHIKTHDHSLRHMKA